MIVEVLDAGVGTHATVRVSELPDGVNEPNVIELAVGREARSGTEPVFSVRVRAGTHRQLEKAGDESSDTEWPDRLLTTTWRPE